MQNNLNRLAGRKSRLLLFIVLTAAAIAAAVFINNAGVTGRVAVVSSNGRTLETGQLSITTLDEAPPLSDLVMGKYDAVVIFHDNGSAEIHCIRNNEPLLRLLDSLVYDPSLIQTVEPAARLTGNTILGFIMMFVLMQGVTLTFLFAEDKEKKQLERVSASPVSFGGYLGAHSLTTFTFMFVPTTLMLLVARYLLGVDMGFDAIECIFLLALMCMLSTAFSLFITAVIDTADSANMTGSAIVVLTSVLAGSFYSFDKGNAILEAVIRVLPQKAFLTMSGLIEQGAGLSTWSAYAAYVVMLCAMFFAVAIVKTRHDYVRA
jgi:ABC-2 type transport system permease protein